MELRPRRPLLGPKPLYQELEVGPPALWVSRFGLPVGGSLLDSGLDSRAEYADCDALALSPADTLSFEPTTSSQGAPTSERDLYRELEVWASAPWRDDAGRVISESAWAELSAQLQVPLPLVMCALSYELGAERAGVSAPDSHHPAPLVWAARYSAVYLWCRRRHRGFVIGASRRAVDTLVKALDAPLREQRSSGEHPLARASHNPWLTRSQQLTQGELRPHMGWPAYRGALHEVRELLLSGDLYQLNFTQGLSAKLREEVTVEEVFTRLHTVNSGQFGALFRLDETRSIISLSPERLVKWGTSDSAQEGRLIETAPIKGTRPRHPDPDQDQREIEALKASEKDQAEHVMILDLERNDLGRICETGSVEVVVDREARSYATVHHLVSVVRGALRPEVTFTEILEAVFPGGSVTGAPKRRAMQAIRSLERGPRGIYCGALGYLDPCGGGDLNLPIRTAFIEGDRFLYHAGGGVVADSTPQGEWEEMWIKTRGVLRGLGLQD